MTDRNTALEALNELEDIDNGVNAERFQRIRVAELESLTHDDWCLLSQHFHAAGRSHVNQMERINNFLKAQISRSALKGGE